MKRKEIFIFGIILAAVNIPLLSGGFFDQLIYSPEKVLVGQWWRIVTHPFVHVSIYHLLLDGAAFLLLYAQLVEKSIVKRLGYLLAIHVAVALAVTTNLSVQTVGYCGLSGLAHGLMAIWCLERIGSLKENGFGDKTEQLIAAGVFIGLLIKCIFEVAVGHAFFETMHLGSVGVPIVASHLAGVIGAVIMYGLLNLSELRITNKRLTLKILETIK